MRKRARSKRARPQRGRPRFDTHHSLPVRAKRHLTMQAQCRNAHAVSVPGRSAVVALRYPSLTPRSRQTTPHNAGTMQKRTRSKRARPQRGRRASIPITHSPLAPNDAAQCRNAHEVSVPGRSAVVALRYPSLTPRSRQTTRHNAGTMQKRARSKRARSQRERSAVTRHRHHPVRVESSRLDRSAAVHAYCVRVSALCLHCEALVGANGE